MKSADQDFILLDLLPHSLRRDARIVNAMKSLQPQLRDLYGHLDDGAVMAQIDSLPEAVLDHLAKQWNAAVWRDYWPAETRRRALKSLITEKRRLGTLTAVKNAISSLGSAAYIREWWEYDPVKTAHTFQVIISQNAIDGVASADLLYDLKRLIDYAKPVRSQYSFVVTYKTAANLTLRAIGRPTIRLWSTFEPQCYNAARSELLPHDIGRGFVRARLDAPFRIPNVQISSAHLTGQTVARPIVKVSSRPFLGLSAPVYGAVRLQATAPVHSLSIGRLAITDHLPNATSGSAALTLAAAVRGVVMAASRPFLGLTDPLTGTAVILPHAAGRNIVQAQGAVPKPAIQKTLTAAQPMRATALVRTINRLRI